MRIREILTRVLDEEVVLSCGLNRRIERRLAAIRTVARNTCLLELTNAELQQEEVTFFSFELGGIPYFFETRVAQVLAPKRVEIAIPTVLYHAERRARLRVDGNRASGSSFAPEDLQQDGYLFVDGSPEGVAIELPVTTANRMLRESRTVFLEIASGSRYWGTIRHTSQGQRPGWIRLGFQLSPGPIGAVATERWEDSPYQRRSRRINLSLKIVLGGAQIALNRALESVGKKPAIREPRVVDFYDSSNRVIRSLVDSWGPLAGGTTVIIPPAWGRTKETLMPLAATIVASFRKAHQPITVIRFDGINKRGESYRSASLSGHSSAQYDFTFSQGVDDIGTVIDNLHRDRATAPATTILVSFSAASIESRRTAATDPRVTGWISVVGSADLQSMMKSISGGIDFALGAERGVRFGIQEILGVSVDMDKAARDALDHHLVYMNDAKRDMARIDVPITWIRGRYDAWMDAGNVEAAMEVGDTSRRKIIDVPTGHMLRASREALAVFELVAREVGNISGVAIGAGRSPRLVDLERQRRAELARLNSKPHNLRAFWEDYLLGKDRGIGFDLMARTSAYAELMASQIGALHLESSTQCVVDIGSGTGAFLYYLAKNGVCLDGGRIIEVDFVHEGLRRARARHSSTTRCSFIEADVDGGTAGIGLPLRSGCADAVVASLVLSYVSDPRCLLAEIRRILRPHGRLVVSSLRRDADMSKLFRDGVRELEPLWDTELASWSSGGEFVTSTRAYLNEASRLLDLEESGQFSFWDVEELDALLAAEGFRGVKVWPSLGSPPQAVVASAFR